MEKKVIVRYLKAANKVSEMILDCSSGVQVRGIKRYVSDDVRKITVTDAIDLMSTFFINHNAGTEGDLSQKKKKKEITTAIQNLVQSVKTINTHYNAEHEDIDMLEINNIQEGEIHL